MSCETKTVELNLALPMRTIGDEDRAIRTKLRNLQSTYVPELDGVLTKFKDLKIVSDKGLIMDEQPYIFWRVRIVATVFKPTEGKVVKGRVHSMMTSYFLVKVNNAFTATVTIPEELKQHNMVQNLMIEQEVYFKILGTSEGVYRGEIDEECAKLTCELNSKLQKTTEADVYEYAKDFEY